LKQDLQSKLSLSVTYRPPVILKLTSLPFFNRPRLDMFPKLGSSIKTTNCIENVMHQVGIYTDRVSYWKNSDQLQRWVGTAL
jgi:hypothetical protein